jgi:hypothetical protein
MGQLLVPDGIFQGGGDMLLPHDRREILRTVFPRGNDEMIHGRKIHKLRITHGSLRNKQ